MTIDRDLLWKAWPDGYLAMRGVSTVGGMTCVSVTEDEAVYGPQQEICIRLKRPDICFDQDCRRLHEQGSLLPNVDPSDTATWACLLQDLVQACLFPQNNISTYWSFAYDKDLCAWFLRGWERLGRDNILYEREFLGIDTVDDPAEALVHARIQLHKKG